MVLPRLSRLQLARPLCSQDLLNERAAPIGIIVGIEVYEVLGYARPEPELRYISRNWENLPEDARRHIREMVDKYVNPK